MKIRIIDDDSYAINGIFTYLWSGIGTSEGSDFAITIQRYVSECISKFSKYGYHYIGDWENRDECLDFIVSIMRTEFLNVVSPLFYDGRQGMGVLFGLTGNPIPDDFASTFVSEISEDIRGTEGKETTLTKTMTSEDNETNMFEKDSESITSYQEQKTNTKTNEDSVTSTETNSGSDFTQDDGATTDTITYGKKVEKEGENWGSNEGSSTGNEQLERVPINAITDDIKTPFSKGAQSGTHFVSTEGGYTDDAIESGADIKDFQKENRETVNYGKIVDKTDTVNKSENESVGNDGEKIISDTHIDNETKVKNSSENDNETEVLSGSNDTTRDYRKSDTSKSIDDIIKSHEYLNKVRNYFYSIIFEWTSRFVDEYNTVY